MNREELLKISRELIDAIMYGKKGALKKEHYFMISISKFIATKEQLINTDSDGKKLFFKDTEENKKIIDDFYKLIESKVSFTVNNLEAQEHIYNNVILEIDNNDIELKKKIFIINKLRDSLAHGRYSFDIEKNIIRISNDYKVNDDEMLFKCDIEPEILDKFNLSKVSKLKSTLERSISNDSNDIDFLNLVSDVNRINKEFIKYERFLDESDVKLFRKIYDETIYKIEEVIDKSKSKRLVYTKTKIDHKEHINKVKDMEIEKLIDKIADSIIAMTSIIDSNLNKNSIITTIIYNHLCLLMSERQELDFKYLRNPLMKITFKKKIENNKETDITGALGLIKREIKIFNKKYQKALSFPEDIRKPQMRKIFIELYDGIMKAFEIRNRNVYNRIRNGIMHFTIDKEKSKITITDSPDHDKEEPNFKCETTNETLVEYIKSIEEPSTKETYTVEAFISELYVALNNYELDQEQTRRFISNLSDCLLYIDKSIKLSDNIESLKSKYIKMNANGYLEDITRLRDALISRKEELEDKPQSM